MLPSIKFNLRDTNAPRETSIIGVIRYNGHRIKVSTQETVAPKNWLHDKQRVKATTRNTRDVFKDTNGALNNFRMVVEDVFVAIQKANNRIPEPDELKEKIKTRINLNSKTVLEALDTDSKKHFYGFVEWYIEHSKTRPTKKDTVVTPRTIEKYNRTLRYIKLYELWSGKAVDFDTIDKTFHEGFRGYLVNEKELSKNTIANHIKDVKTFLNAATAYGYNSNMFYKSSEFGVSKEKTEAIYLNETEIMGLYAFDLSKHPSLERVRDLFVFGCWTGLRFSDYTRVTAEHIDGEFISIYAQKTGKSTVIPMHPIVKEILTKYDNGLPRQISNAKFNKYIKDAGRIAGINELVDTKITKGGKPLIAKREKWELITTHTARRSFATNMYKKGCPVKTIMTITGHAKEATFYEYIRMNPKEHAEQVAKFF